MNKTTTFQEFLTEPTIDYDLYCEALDAIAAGNLNEGLFDKIKDAKLTGKLVKIFKELKSSLEEIGNQFKIGLSDLIKAFKEKSVFGVLRAVGFNIKTMLKAVGALTKAFRSGLLSIFEEMAKNKVFQKIRSGAMKVDELLNKYPKLKKVAGIVVAGLLIYIWLNMTFIGDLDYDFDFGSIAAALSGSFSLTDLFVSPEGLMLITLLGTGSLLGLSAPWLGKTAYNLLLAITYTGFIKMRSKTPTINKAIRKIKSKMKKV